MQSKRAAEAEAAAAAAVAAPTAEPEGAAEAAAAASPEGAAAPLSMAAGGQKRRVRDDAECVDGLGAGTLIVAENGMLVSVGDAAESEGAEGAGGAAGDIDAAPVAAQLGCDPTFVRLTLTKGPHAPQGAGAGAGGGAAAREVADE